MGFGYRKPRKRQPAKRKKKTTGIRKKRRASSLRAPLPRNWSKGTRNRRVTLSWAVRRYLSKLKKAGY